jgi:hypothetical protein
MLGAQRRGETRCYISVGEEAKKRERLVEVQPLTGKATIYEYQNAAFLGGTRCNNQ